MAKRTIVAGAAVAFAAVAGAVHYITADGGGSVYDYVKQYDAYYARGDKIVVRGQCYSSCTMVLAYPNACLEPTAVLGFHPAYTPYLFGLLHYRLSPAATEEMRRHYPPDALAVINRYGGLSDKGGWLRPEITLIRASEFPARYHCK